MEVLSWEERWLKDLDNPNVNVEDIKSALRSQGIRPPGNDEKAIEKLRAHCLKLRAQKGGGETTRRHRKGNPATGTGRRPDTGRSRPMADPPKDASKRTTGSASGSKPRTSRSRQGAVQTPPPPVVVHRNNLVIPALILAVAVVAGFALYGTVSRPYFGVDENALADAPYASPSPATSPQSSPEAAQVSEAPQTSPAAASGTSGDANGEPPKSGECTQQPMHGYFLDPEFTEVSTHNSPGWFIHVQFWVNYEDGFGSDTPEWEYVLEPGRYVINEPDHAQVQGWVWEYGDSCSRSDVEEQMENSIRRRLRNEVNTEGVASQDLVNRYFEKVA